ncbi:MAG TPA: M56 family metallopeptidase [Chitinophagaceae bacterium]|jgi:beta-lactamase regulating signal transducer with metallopeptidase domain|nr:M56 family metallopeptidase [Chitinophagaceae bacterium]
MILYFIKTVILLGVFYGMYALFLKNNKSLRWNRLYLVFTILLSILLPLLNGFSFGPKLASMLHNGMFSDVLIVIDVLANQLNKTTQHYGKIIFGFYMLGLLWGLLRIVLGFVVIRRIQQSAVYETIAEQPVYFSEHIESPFSYFKRIYIPSQYKKSSMLHGILLHEKAHVKKLHSRDKILFSFLQAFCWMNPFVYLYHKELDWNHVYEADEMVTLEINTGDYCQDYLLKSKSGLSPTRLVNHFFYQPIQKRIDMLNKKSFHSIGLQMLVVLVILMCSILMLVLQSDVK